jgi:hypothetical protein
MLYRVFDLIVHSNIPLPDYEQIPAGAPTLWVTRRSGALPVPPDLVWTDVWGDLWSDVGTTTPRQPVWRFAWHGPDLLLVIPKCGGFRFENGFRSIICHPYSSTDRRLAVDLSHSILPRVLVEWGHLVVHASCVTIEGGRSVVFVGPSGAGKSTLAASFAVDGGQLVSDDCVLLKNAGGRLIAHAAGVETRLWDDSLCTLFGEVHAAQLVSKKPTASKWSVRLGPDTSLPRSVPVDAIFALSAREPHTDGDDVEIAEESGARLLSLLTDFTLLFDPIGRRNRSRRFVGASEVADACPAFYSLSYPRQYSRLPEVRRAIVAKALESRHASMDR